MKIYNKKKFISAVGWCLFGSLNLIIGFIHSFNIKDIILTFVMFSFGISGILRSLSQECFSEDILEENDERNQLINIKAKFKAFQIMQNTFVIVGVFCVIYGVISMKSMLSYIGIGLSLLWTISMVVELFTSLYYEKYE